MPSLYQPVADGKAPGHAHCDLYAPLPLQENEIRILTVHAGESPTPLQCTLLKIPLLRPTTPRYETISYTWGSSHQGQDAIFINNTYMEVPHNTFRALRSARSAHKDRQLWIDFVCINQNDLNERNKQVSLMANVYQSSHCNLIYLGEDNVQPTAAFDCIERLASEAEAEMALQNATLDEILFPEREFIFSAKPVECKIDVEALAWLYRLPWFGRHWVLQEACLSPYSIATCGIHTIDFERIMIATAWLEHKTFVVDIPTSHLLKLPGFRGANNMQLLRASINRHNLSQLSASLSACSSSNESIDLCTRGQDCRPIRSISQPFAYLLAFSPFGDSTDVRDQVFGLIGLYQFFCALNSLPSTLRPDYHKSIPDTLRDATRYAIEEGKCLTILERKPLNRSVKFEGLPTWVPEWFRPSHYGDARSLTYTALACSTHKKWSLACIRDSQDPNILCIPGTRVDTVLQTSETATLSNLHDPHWSHGALSSWQKMAESAHQSIESLGKTVLGGEWWNGTMVTPNQAAMWPHFLKDRRCQCAVCSPPVQHPPDDPVGKQDISGFFTALTNACNHRRFFTTTAGRIGIGPSEMRVGDDICILQGGTLPFVLRRDGDYDELIGPTYTHGIMYGEAVEEHDHILKDIMETTFNIK
ncbi:hypothetical protein K491DRAFT_347136 [Lophiostoma macrostomum CBS 122681]|uniref:Heterokaryon incompatibility domain-containing protein n=1 Tax=Lophiostoma macrostomum CBS 122681 TaxID=1314788 RepID=A0A6A6TE55_9PLEO|nr:hypothetical protein K491DRAFT_347136 [Lophiostoma macrostomum CBS 122681]